MIPQPGSPKRCNKARDRGGIGMLEASPRMPQAFIPGHGWTSVPFDGVGGLKEFQSLHVHRTFSYPAAISINRPQTNAFRMAGNKVDDGVSVDGGSCGLDFTYCHAASRSKGAKIRC